MKKEVLGIDIGGPIINHVDDWLPDELVGDAYLETGVTRGAFKAIRQLVEKRFGENVFLVSVRRLDTIKNTLAWLEHHNFYKLSGVKEGNTQFCQKRVGKGQICQDLGITHFIDDKLENLSYLATVEHKILFRPNPDEVAKFLSYLVGVTQVNSWSGIKKLLLP